VHRNGTVIEGKPARSVDDSYTPGAFTSASNSVQAPSGPGGNAVNLSGLMSSNAAGSQLVPALGSGFLSSLPGGGTSAPSQTQTGTSSLADSSVLSQLEAAIRAAAADGSQDSNWMDDLVSYASGLVGGTNPAAGSAGAGGALASDLGGIEAVIQRIASQVSSALAAQGASPSMMGAAVNALTTSLTLNSLGAVARQIAAKTASTDTFTVTSSVVTISANGTSSVASLAGQTENFSGVNTNLGLVTTGGTASVPGGSGASGNGTSLSSQGFGYRFAISESGPDGDAYVGTSDVSADATATSSTGAGGSASASAALEEDSTVYENEGASSAANNSAMVLMSDWQANLESTAAQNTNSANAASGANAQQAQPGTRTLTDFVNAAAHVLFKQALALLEGMFRADTNSAGPMGRGRLLDVYA
jgi:hypothetical protein